MKLVKIEISIDWAVPEHKKACLSNDRQAPLKLESELLDSNHFSVRSTVCCDRYQVISGDQ